MSEQPVAPVTRAPSRRPLLDADTPPSEAPPVVDDGLMIRRGTKARFHRRPVPENSLADEPMLLLNEPRPKADHKTDRRRLISGDLPEWDPLPPGEITVTRKAARRRSS